MKTRGREAYVLVEVLAAMTILAIAGTVLMRSLQNAMDATMTVRKITKAIYLTETKLNEFKISYNHKAGADLGEFRGRYSQPGASEFQWTAWVENNREYDAYVITVTTTWGDQGVRRRRGRYRNDASQGFMLKTMVPKARINDELLFGGGHEIGSRRRESRGTSRERGSRTGGVPGGGL
ncbi:MAG: hypothetical protein GC154_10125 [bacterium]|nr:hypothetical protein [bacterium]